MGKIIPKSMLLVALYELNRAAKGVSIDKDSTAVRATGNVIKILTGMDLDEWEPLPGAWYRDSAVACRDEIIRQFPETIDFLNKKIKEGSFRNLFEEATHYAGDGTLILREPA